MKSLSTANASWGARVAARVWCTARAGRIPVSLLAAWALVAVPRLAAACAVCTSGREDESNTAFLISTIFLSLLPLAGLGTLVFVVWRRLRALEAGREPAAAAPPSVIASAPADSIS